MVAARPVAPTQPHLARLRVERQYRLIEELRLAAGRHATAEDLAAALRVDVRTVERDIARLRDTGVPIAARRAPGGGFRLDVPPSVRPRSTSPRRDRRPDRLRRLRRPRHLRHRPLRPHPPLEAVQYPTPNRSSDP
jgi:biotin operon repressor